MLLFAYFLYNYIQTIEFLRDIELDSPNEADMALFWISTLFLFTCAGLRDVARLFVWWC